MPAKTGTWNKVLGKWRAEISVRGSSVTVGAFDDEEDAARAYDAALVEYRNAPTVKLSRGGAARVGAGRTAGLAGALASSPTCTIARKAHADAEGNCRRPGRAAPQ